MKFLIAVVILALAVTAVVPPAFADGAKPINLCLFDPVQIFNRDTAIHGVRLSIYGRNAELKGIDVGIANWVTGDVAGLQYGVLNMAEGTMAGLQWGVVNWTKGDFTGWQTGPVQNVDGFMTGLQTSMILSMNGGGKGVQFAGISVSDNFVGLQLGIVNYSAELYGLQLGLINIIKEGGFLPFFPIFNFDFTK